MPKYEARQCEGSSDEKWCIYVNDVCDHSLGEFNSQPEAEAVVRQLILRDMVLAIDASAKIEVAVPAQNRSYSGPVVATIHPSEGCGCGVAQKSARDIYTLHTGKDFAGLVPQEGISIAVEYRNGEAKATLPKTKERENER